MNKLFSYSEWTSINESFNQFEAEMDIITEGIADVISSPVKYTKIKNNAKKYQQALVQKATAETQYVKQKQKISGDAKASAAVKDSYDNQQEKMRDNIEAISGRMDDLASTDVLKNVVKLAKSKSKKTASEIALKTATGAHAEELKKAIATAAASAKAAEQSIKKETSKKEPVKEAPKKEPVKETPKKETPVEDSKKDVDSKIEKLSARIKEAELDKKEVSAELDKARGTENESEVNGRLSEIVTRIEDMKKNLKELEKNK